MYNLIGQNFINMVKTFNPNIKIASGGREIVTRCMFCGDSDNPKHAHFYISVPGTPEELSFYHCKKCGSHGIVTDELLRKIGCNDTQLLVEFLKHNIAVMNLPKYKTLKLIDIYPLTWFRIRKANANAAKMKYIGSRIGWNDLSFNDIIRLKIFLNLYDVLNDNHLELTRDKYITDALDSHFIGFISYDNSFANMRLFDDYPKIPPSINKRYINYDLVNKPEDSKNFYVIPTQINVLDPTPVKIHVAEGPFDILSVFHNLNGGYSRQSAYMACGGKSYTQAIEFLLTETGLVNFEIHIYPDADVNDWYVQTRIISKINKLACPIYVHRNGYPNEKDFGVPPERIKDYVRKFDESPVY